MGFINGKVKSRRRLFILLIEIFVIAVIITDFLHGGLFSPSPEKSLMEYMDLVKKGQYEEMYGMLDEKSRASVSKDRFIRRNRAIYSGMGMTDLKVTVSKYHWLSHTLEYSTSMETVAGTIQFDNTARFRANGIRYRLAWDDSMIIPGLKQEDRVQVRTEKAMRGRILDRNGQMLAENIMATSVGIVPADLEDRENSVREIASLLEMDPSAVEEKLSASWVRDDYFVPVRTLQKLGTEDPAPDLAEHRRQDQLLAISGVRFRNVYIRSYPLKEAAAHLVGYVQSVTAEDLEKHKGEGYTADSLIGRSGLEAVFEKELKGQDGGRIVIVDKDGKTKKTLASRTVKKGKDIEVTIDSEVQKALFEQLKEDKSCSVAMNPVNGDVYALVSTPSYDPNAFILGISDEAWKTLNEDEKQPLLNRFRQTWCPGSSFKPVVAEIGLENHAFDPGQEAVYSGLRWQKDSSWGSYYVTTLHEYSPKTLENALIYSDNIYFAQSALKIGSKTLESSLKKIGFQKTMPFDISMTESQFSNSDHISSEIQLADSGYGQGQILVNPLHLACIYTSLCNSGSIIKPVLRKQEGSGGEIWIDRAFSPETSAQILEGTKKVVSDPQGTGHAAARTGTVLAGKTGTAEIKLSKDDASGTELGWFVLFTADPAQEKPILLMSMVEDVKGRGGSSYTVRKESDVMDWWLDR